MSELLKSAFYTSMHVTGLFELTRYLNRKNGLILTYHGVLETGSENYVNRNCVSREMFDRQISWVKKKCTPVSLSDMVQMVSGKKKMPPNAVAITFDDGFRNNYRVAFPVLKKHDVPATIFITTDFIGSKGEKLWTERIDSIIYSATIRRLRLPTENGEDLFDISTPENKIQSSDKIRKYLKSKSRDEREQHIMELERQIEGMRSFIDEMDERYDFLDWDEVSQMVESGLIEIGSHTCSHSILSTLTEEEVHSELLNSKMAIEAQLNKPCTLFSYPNGTPSDFTHRDKKVLQKLGYETALSQIDGLNGVGEDIYALKRINIVRSPNFPFFLSKATGIWGKMKRLSN
ncbi:MAG: polysaccharide deacetylase family protein [Deferribacteres bacterium]|nr:polysaccharide deacetylase family protein [candidate division KSB1 bacterium]MCB9504120.1 polysaccharide deacetylase family protein [Deferribacteres bacterium]